MSLESQLAPSIRAAGLAKHLAALKALEAELDVRAPRDTGALRHSRRARTTPTLSIIRTDLSYDIPYAVHTDVGPKAHRITARNAKVLRFKAGGRTLYRRSVYWRPGAGVAKNRGWFSKTVKRWGIFLRAVR